MLIFCDQRVTIVLRPHQSGTASEGDTSLIIYFVLVLNHTQMNRGYDPDVCFSSPEMLTLEWSCLCEKGVFTKGDRTRQLPHHPFAPEGSRQIRFVCVQYIVSHKKITATQTCSGPVWWGSEECSSGLRFTREAGSRSHHSVHWSCLGARFICGKCSSQGWTPTWPQLTIPLASFFLFQFWKGLSYLLSPERLHGLFYRHMGVYGSVGKGIHHPI